MKSYGAESSLVGLGVRGCDRVLIDSFKITPRMEQNETESLMPRFQQVKEQKCRSPRKYCEAQFPLKAKTHGDHRTIFVNKQLSSCLTNYCSDCKQMQARTCVENMRTHTHRLHYTYVLVGCEDDEHCLAECDVASTRASEHCGEPVALLRMGTDTDAGSTTVTSVGDAERECQRCCVSSNLGVGSQVKRCVATYCTTGSGAVGDNTRVTRSIERHAT